MKEFSFLLFSLIFIIKSLDTSKTLMIFFTRTNNTLHFANYINEILNIETYQIIPANPYTDKVENVIELARQERNNGTRPEIINPLIEISNYDTIFLGYPLWHSNLPNIVINQLEKLNFKGKTIYPFNTYGTTGVGNSTNDIKNYAPGAIVKEGFAISDYNIKIKNDSMIKIKKWLNKNFHIYFENIEDEEDISGKKSENNYDKLFKFKYSLLFILYILFV